MLQGFDLADYHRHADIYEAAGFDLSTLDTVGVGSVCRRQNTSVIEAIVTSLAARGYRLHGFGVKTKGFARYSHALASADSLSWSKQARMAGPDPDCPHGRFVPHLGVVVPGTCANCMRYALAWRADLLTSVPTQQLGVAA